MGFGGLLGAPGAATQSLLRHLDHAVDLIGHDRVETGMGYAKDMEMIREGMGSSRGGAWRGTQISEGACFQPEQLPQLVDMMLEHGCP